MSVSTGRMSRADAQRLLNQITPALQEFHNPAAPASIYAEAVECGDLLTALQQELDTGSAPNAAALRSLRARIAAMQWDRLQNSMRTPPRVTAAVCVTLYGEDDRILAVEGAAQIAAIELSVPTPEVRLQDSSHVRTATLTGTRYIFTSTAP